MTVAFRRQYPLASPGSDGQIITLEVSRPELAFSLCFTSSPMAAPIPLDPAWDVLEFWSNEVCLVGFNNVSVTRPDSVGTPVPFSYVIGASAIDKQKRMVLTPPNHDQVADPNLTDRFLSVIGLVNPGELFVSVLTRYEAIAIDESVQRG